MHLHVLCFVDLFVSADATSWLAMSATFLGVVVREKLLTVAYWGFILKGETFYEPMWLVRATADYLEALEEVEGVFDLIFSCYKSCQSHLFYHL